MKNLEKLDWLTDQEKEQLKQAQIAYLRGGSGIRFFVKEVNETIVEIEVKQSKNITNSFLTRNELAKRVINIFDRINLNNRHLLVDAI